MEEQLGDERNRMTSNPKHRAVHGPVVCASVALERHMDLKCQVNDHPEGDTEDPGDEAVHCGIEIQLPEMGQTPVVRV